MTNPGSINNILPRSESWIVKELKELRRMIQQLATARVGNKMTIDGKPGISVENGGNITIFDGGSWTMATPSGQVVVFAGTINIPDGSGRTQQVFEIYRDDGTPAYYIGDFGTVPGHAHQQSWAFLDRAQNVIMAEDTVSGHGLANPYVGFSGFVDLTPPAATTTSTSFQALQWGWGFQQNPRVKASILAQTPAGVTAEFRFTMGGVAIGSPVTVAASTFGQVSWGAYSWPTFTNGAEVTVQLEGRVASGTGTIGARVIGFSGYQS